jgi:hypothetical protein
VLTLDIRFFHHATARFFVSSHYTNYAPASFFLSLIVTIIGLIAKLPLMHQVRLFDINQKIDTEL